MARSTIFRYENGDIEKLPTSILEPIAKVLNTTPAYLMEWENNTKTPILTKKDRRDIAREVERIMDDLEHSGDLMFDGDPMSKDAKDSMRAAMQLGLEAAKLKNKETYTPKKYRGGAGDGN